jgi:hypothetical protein
MMELWPLQWEVSWDEVLEVPFPNNDQRNTQELLSKAKGKVLLLVKGTATDSSLIGRTHLDGKYTQIIFLTLSPVPQ